ncbi:MAG: hypothetical protein HY830_18990 [Actinobacteria bacterium]|nr:hypothetical protein [Actinomycetota bacterium]
MVGATATTVLAPPAAAAGPGPGPVLVCETGICLLDPSGVDSDGDGWSDADERAAGTDPSDPQSHPRILEVLDAYAGGVRPDGFAQREVLVLPTQAPDGTALASDLLALGPKRGEALTRLGLDPARLGEVDVSNGLRVVLDLGGKDQSTGRPPAKVGGVNMSEIGWLITSSTEDSQGNLVTIFQTEGFRSETIDGFVVTDGKGVEHQSVSSEITRTGKDGTTTTTNTVSARDKNPDGSSTTTATTWNETKDKDGKTVLTTLTVTTTTVDDKGNRTEVADRTVTAKDGTKTVESTTTTTAADGRSTTTRTCTGPLCAALTSGEVDGAPPVVPGGTLVVTPEQGEAFEKIQGTRTNQGDTPVEVGPEDAEPPQYSPLHPGLILVDPNNDAVWYTPVPRLPDPDKAGGNTTFVRGVNQPDTTCIPSPTMPCPA